MTERERKRVRETERKKFGGNEREKEGQREMREKRLCALSPWMDPRKIMRENPQ